MSHDSMILCGDSKKFEYLGENETKNETILIHWSGAQASLNDEKNWGAKISWTIPLRKFLANKMYKLICINLALHVI